MSCFLFLFSLLMQKSSYCSCIPLGPIDDKQYNEYNLIVEGKVSKVVVQNFERTIYLAAKTYYKGGNSQTIVKITTPSQEGECGIFPKVGETWLMFAYTNGKNYRTELCTRTKNMNPKVWNYNKDEIADDKKFLEAKITENSR
jgi:hypothetical protein